MHLNIGCCALCNAKSAVICDKVWGGRTFAMWSGVAIHSTLCFRTTAQHAACLIFAPPMFSLQVDKVLENHRSLSFWKGRLLRKTAFNSIRCGRVPHKYLAFCKIKSEIKGCVSYQVCC